MTNGISTPELELVEVPAEPTSEAPGTVDVSVVIPVLNEEGSIAELSRQLVEVLDGTGRSFEIVYVDDGSRDRTVAEVRQAHQRDDVDIINRFKLRQRFQ